MINGARLPAVWRWPARFGDKDEWMRGELAFWAHNLKVGVSNFSSGTNLLYDIEKWLEILPRVVSGHVTGAGRPHTGYPG